LGSRFGDELLYRLDQALGNEPELLTPFRPPPVLKSSLRIGRPTARYDVLREALERVLTCFCEQLERRVAGVRQLLVTFYCPELWPITFELNVSQPTRSVKHLGSLLNARLNVFHLPAGAAGVMLWARRVEPLDAWQEELFDTGRADEEGLAELIDRLTNRLGPRAVVRPQPVSEHQPERAFEYVPLIELGARNAELGTRNSERGTQKAQRRVRNAACETRSAEFSLLTSPFSPRPLRLLPRPVEVPVIAVVPEGPPTCFDWQGSRQEVVGCVGPERLETGWWRGRHVRRDYFRVACRSGRGCWLFRQRETGRWFLHGWFD
jgi:protein ImuB